jgi:hypothetical protein
VRQAAAGALGQIRDARAVEPLVTALKDQDDAVRQAAAAALGKIGDARTVEPLMAALKDKNSSVQEVAAKELIKMGYEVLPPKWPRYSVELVGHNIIRVSNSNEFKVRVGVRSGVRGKDFVVPANGTGGVGVPNGSYDIYFQYSTEPLALYQGDSFTLNNGVVTIRLEKVIGGTYGIRKVG